MANIAGQIVFVLAALAVLGCEGTPMAPSRLRIEYLREPLGMDEAKPRFSWALENSDRGEGQSAYRITVATVSGISLEKAKRTVNSTLGLAAEEGLLSAGAMMATVWDSGLIKSSQSTQVVYAGEALTSDTVYMWTVSSPWSVYNSIHT